MEIIKLIASIATPLIIFFLGILFLRKIESIKRMVMQTSEFESKWASGFFDACNDFMKKTERIMALLPQLQGLGEDVNNDIGKRYQKEINSLAPEISECELKIRRYVVLAPRNGPSAKEKADAIMDMFQNMAKNLETHKNTVVNLDDLFSKLKDFSVSARSAHAEMLNINKRI